jgi:transcriptional regulator with XRE-family HTH domain
MGRAARRAHHYPKRLGEKLRYIRTALKLSQNGMLKHLGSPKGILGTSISAYERGLREPPLLILLEYARIAGVTIDTLVDDAVDLHHLSNSPCDKRRKQLIFTRSQSKQKQ